MKKNLKGNLTLALILFLLGIVASAKEKTFTFDAYASLLIEAKIEDINQTLNKLVQIKESCDYWAQQTPDPNDRPKHFLQWGKSQMAINTAWENKKMRISVLEYQLGQTLKRMEVHAKVEEWLLPKPDKGVGDNIYHIWDKWNKSKQEIRFQLPEVRKALDKVYQTTAPHECHKASYETVQQIVGQALEKSSKWRQKLDLKE